MFLKYIEIQGFKSFPDKTRLAFGREITAIVGPNGSGKSNISDSVRWVLGEQSSKSLRGGKMEDVIFGGTRIRKPMGFAQVTLCLDNASGRLPEAGAEVTVSRRFYRSGESDYILNGKPVRLRDVRETFMNTGLSRDGYSIIEQGRISEIVAAKSVDRREIFEEASGIAKYRFRKNEAQRKLAQAEDNLSRLRDITDELKSRVEPLREQSEKAEKFLVLSAERKNLEITLYCDTVERSRKSVRTQEDRIETAKSDYAGIESRISDIDARFQKNYERGVELIGATNEANGEIDGLNGGISELERAITAAESGVFHALEQIIELRGEKDSAAGAGEETDGAIERKKSEIEERKRELAGAEEKIRDTERRLLAVASEDEESSSRRQSAAGEILRLSAELAEFKALSVSKRTEVGELLVRAAAAEEALTALGENRARVFERAAEIEAAVLEQEELIKSGRNRREGYLIKLNGRSERIEHLAAEIEKERLESSEAAHRLAALEDMERSLEGLAKSVRRVLEAAREHSLGGIIGTVSSLLSIKSGCETAIETALGGNIQNIVVEDERSAKDAIRLLREEKAGRATFLPLDTVRPSSFDKRDLNSLPGIVGLASDLVGTDGRYSGVISNLLGRIVIAEDLDAASSAARRLNYRFRVVTMDGQVINAGGSYTGGFLSRSAGVFGRRSEMEALRAKLQKSEARLLEIRPEYDVAAAERDVINAEMTTLDAELEELRVDFARAQSEMSFAGSEKETADRTVSAAENELSSMRERIKELTAESERLGQTARETADRISELETSAAADAQSGGEFTRKRNELGALLSDQRVAEMEKLKGIEALETELAALNDRKRTEEERAGDMELRIGDIEKANGERRREIEEKSGELETAKDRISVLRGIIDKAVKERMELDRQDHELREFQASEVRIREEAAKEISRLEERREALRREYDGAVAKLWEDYELSPAEAMEMCVEFSSVALLRQSVGRLRAEIKALGTVNVGAVEEYKEVSERYAFLNSQVEDVEQSRQSLISMIVSLTAEMRSLFVGSFEEINRNFKGVFTEMFSGGDAGLSLSDESDVLECGIEIDVQPPGKVIKNLASLSGGEQSLVAIALYFAILKANPAPFCILDEIDSALDEINVSRFSAYLQRLIENTQIISITHRRGTMEAADVLYGVTMQEEGVSKVLRLSVSEARLVVSN